MNKYEKIVLEQLASNTVYVEDLATHHYTSAYQGCMVRAHYDMDGKVITKVVIDSTDEEVRVHYDMDGKVITKVVADLTVEEECELLDSFEYNLQTYIEHYKNKYDIGTIVEQFIWHVAETVGDLRNLANYLRYTDEISIHEKAFGSFIIYLTDVIEGMEDGTPLSELEVYLLSITEYGAEGIIKELNNPEGITLAYFLIGEQAIEEMKAYYEPSECEERDTLLKIIDDVSYDIANIIG